ncbi:10011_t:CDS:2 [Gigaspora margarita]|uniref:10011_t:CDS:1 n=1 Tax=Gigaspora margarita TaxID=4874 RepID=A0ABN7UW96_GIGMA|nr:10011_t:CDS:2 [Gigaspora margarita]
MNEPIINLQPLFRMRELLKKSLQDVENELDEMAAIQAFEDYLILKKILNKYPYTFYAYGSRVKGTARKFSDLDLCYQEEIPREVIYQIKEELEESDLPFIVELVN